ncbi:MAG: hypothetical protein ABR567_22240, partial [Myxococcales bacterium]
MAPLLPLLAALSINQPWKQVAPGVETATAAELGGDPGWAARVLVIDPARAQFLVRYDPSRPTLREWRARYPGALAIVNGSFYSKDPDVRPTCDVIIEGKPLKGAGCHRQDALFFGARPRSEAVIPAVSRTPPPARLFTAADFRPDQWIEALKSFPALVHGGSAACNGPHYCAESSRTAALAQMKDGRILLFASQWPAVRREVAKWLAEE